MPMLKLLEKVPQSPWTKMPNSLLDEVMSSLKDTELRILLILMRHTLGWRVPRKHAFLTYDLLCRRTGRKSAAVAKALKGLEAKGFLIRALELSTERLTLSEIKRRNRMTKSEDNK